MSDQRTTDEARAEHADWCSGERHAGCCGSGCDCGAVDVNAALASLRARLAAAEAEVRWVRRLASVRGEVLASALAGVGSTPNPSDEPNLGVWTQGQVDGIKERAAELHRRIAPLFEDPPPVAGEGTPNPSGELARCRHGARSSHAMPLADWCDGPGSEQDERRRARRVQSAQGGIVGGPVRIEHDPTELVIPLSALVRGSHDVPARCKHKQTGPHYYGKTVSSTDSHWTPQYCPGPAAVVPATTEEQK